MSKRTTTPTTKKTTKGAATPIKTWLGWSIIVLGAFLLLTWEYFVAGFSSDTSRISHLLLLFFFFGFFSSLRSAIYLQKEFRSLASISENRGGILGVSSDAARLFRSAKELIDEGERVDIKNLISIYEMKLGIHIRNVSVISGMLITIGLLGTVIGLIITVGGLSTVLEAAGNDYEEMISGMNRTVMGMGTAFYTTFFGGLLGGVVLRVLGSELEKSASQLVAETMELGELWLAPLCHAHAADTLGEIEEQLKLLRGGLEGLGGGINDVVEIIDARREHLHEGMGKLVAEAERSIADTLKQGVKELTDGFSDISGAMEQSMSEMLCSTAQAIEQGTENLSNGFVGISESMEHKMSKVIADATQSMEQGLCEFANGLHSLTENVERSQQPLADGLASLADEVERSIAETRRHSDAQLQNRASDIAQKLNVAAAMLESLCPPDMDAA